MKDCFEFLLDDVENYQKVLEGGLAVDLYFSPMLLWLSTSNFSDYTYMLICTHVYTLVSGIGNLSKKYKTIRSIGLNCYSKVRKT